MPTLNLKPTHKSVKSYYAALDQFAKLGVTHETAVRASFQGLLGHCARQCRWTAGAGVWGEYGAGQADCGGRGAGGMTSG